MTSDTLAAKKEMEEKGCTCVLKKGDDGCFSFDRGVKPLLGWIDEGRDLSLYGAADQVVGKAAALLYVCLGIKDLYARIISEPAERALEENGITYTYGEKVPYIVNRTKDGLCPMEQAVLEVTDPKEAVSVLKNKLSSMKKEIRP